MTKRRMEWTRLPAVTSSAARLGLLTVRRANGKTQELSTPFPLYYTRKALVPGLTPDMLQQVPAIAIAFDHIMNDYTADSVRNNLPHLLTHAYPPADTTVKFAHFRDVGEPPKPVATNGEKFVSIATAQGVKQIQVNHFLEFVRSCPLLDIVAPMADTPQTDGQSSKRISKSVDRTLRFLDDVLEGLEIQPGLFKGSLFGVIAGEKVVEERKRSAEETSLRKVDGKSKVQFVFNYFFLLQGF